ncbi:MAG TPA: Hsp20/alpha crystallin family protein [Bryobacteraceae bacterium]|jgi:HSP20 family protein|nr:Hsp20/alpha crystallin family protein [Bryobacteraceae bacterium]
MRRLFAWGNVKTWSIYLSHPDATNAWNPPVDIYRGPRGWLLKFDLAGVSPSDVKVRISGSRVTVSGVRRDWVVEQGYSHHSMEISYNRFERTVELPGDLSRAEYSLEARDGLLLVRVDLE